MWLTPQTIYTMTLWHYDPRIRGWYKPQIIYTRTRTISSTAVMVHWRVPMARIIKLIVPTGNQLVPDQTANENWRFYVTIACSMMEFCEKIGENSGVNVVYDIYDMIYNHWVLGKIRGLLESNRITVLPTLVQEMEAWNRLRRCSGERKWVMSKLAARGVIGVWSVQCACTAVQPTGPYGE